MSSNVKVCDIGDDIKERLKQFKFRKNEKNAALILKVDREKQSICVDDEIEDITIDELQEQLPGHQPRYIIYSYRMEHDDGRVSFPLCFIYYTPRDSQMDLQIMYAGTKIALQHEAELTRSYEIRELDELTEEWLIEKLRKLTKLIKGRSRWLYFWSLIASFEVMSFAIAGLFKCVFTIYLLLYKIKCRILSRLHN